MKDQRHHWWLRYRNFDIDITYKQFSKSNLPVLVETNSGWHRNNFENFDEKNVFTRPFLTRYFENYCNSLAYSMYEVRRDRKSELNDYMKNHCETLKRYVNK